MKYHLTTKKDQETRSHLLAEAFGSVLGMGLYTSVVNSLPKVMLTSPDRNMPDSTLFSIYNDSDEVASLENSTSRKACIS